MNQKVELRRLLLQRLASLSRQDRSAHSHRICEALAVLPEFRAARHIFAYMALPSEPDILALVEANPEKRWSFPRVDPDGKMTFYRVDNTADMGLGAFGIREPDVQSKQSEPVEAELVLVPGLGFDPANHARLGRGKGYYDRYLAGIDKAGSRPPIIGLCFSLQLESLIVEPHDQPMDRLVTENGLL